MENLFKAKGFLVWLICTLFFLYEFLLRTVIGTFQHSVMLDLNLTSFQFSLLSTTLFLLVYGVMQIPVGLIVDAIGLKKSLLVASVTCAFSTIGFAHSYVFGLAVAFRALMGLGASFGFICLLMSIYDWMPHRYTAIFIGISQFIGTLGPMLAAGPLETVSDARGINWRTVFFSLGIFGLGLVILIMLFVENNKRHSGRYTILRRPEKIMASIRRLFSRVQPWYIAVVSLTLYFTVEYLSENEARTFLSLKGLSFRKASYMITVAWIGYAVGSPCVGLVSDFLQRRKIVIILAAFLQLLAIMTIIYATSSNLILLAFFCLGVSASGQTIGFATMSEQFKPEFVAAGYGLNNGIIMVVSAINAPLIGWLIDYARKGGEVTLNVYFYAFTALIVIALIAVVLAVFFIKETFCKSAADFTYLKPNC